MKTITITCQPRKKYPRGLEYVVNVAFDLINSYEEERAFILDFEKEHQEIVSKWEVSEYITPYSIQRIIKL